MEENFLKEIIIALSSQKVRYIIFGGVAVVLHGVERMTLDLDVSIDMREENLKNFLKVMRDFDLTPRAPISDEVLLDPDTVDYIIREKNAIAFTFIDKQKPYKQVDLLIHPDLSYDKWLPYTINVDLFGHKVCILSREAIIEMKKKLENPRDKDLIDIKELEKKEDKR
ncbi:MAG: hypothetical protein NZ853_01780 [Leptospiraceae bacterium]|nr:hypothetical protein [Leptospiraceae bacterium]MDW7976043.1 hypothetical protein [Leptospiraceae bacterium]